MTEDVKITDLPAISFASDDDVLILVDVDADVTKKISKQNLLAGLSGGNSNIDSATVLSIVTAGDLDMAGNKVLFGNVYSTFGDLPSAASYHGMFAHVHATGAAYFAHAGNWIQLANNADIGGGSSLANIADSADGVVVSGPVTAENYIDIDGVKISSSVEPNGSIVLRSDASGYVGIGIDPQETIQTNLQVGGSGITTSNLEVEQTIILSDLPTSDPSVSGQLWNESGVLKISSGY